MDKKTRLLFLVLVLVQGLHSIEEYIGQLWEVFRPARFLTGLISSDLELGFLVANIGLFVFGIWCWYVPVRKGFSNARGLVAFWIVLEMINGIGHSLMAIYEFKYFPGVVTAPILLVISLSLARKMKFL